MTEEKDWLIQNEIPYYKELNSYRKLLAPVVIFIKRILRRLLKFLFVPMLDDINEYHQHLLALTEQQNAITIQESIAAARAELAALLQSREEAFHEPNSNTLLISGNTIVSRIGSEESSYLVVLDKKDTLPITDGTVSVSDPVTGDLYAGGYGGVDIRLSEIAGKKSGKFFIDIGANVGAFSLFMASKGWRGYSFEASSHNADLLTRSIVLNEFDVSVFNRAVSDYSGHLYFQTNGSPWGVVVKAPVPGVKYEEIPCVALDDMIGKE